MKSCREDHNLNFCYSFRGFNHLKQTTKIKQDQKMVRSAGLEPASLAALGPKPSAFAISPAAQCVKQS